MICNENSTYIVERQTISNTTLMKIYYETFRAWYGQKKYNMIRAVFHFEHIFIVSSITRIWQKISIFGRHFTI